MSRFPEPQVEAVLEALVECGQLASPAHCQRITAGQDGRLSHAGDGDAIVNLHPGVSVPDLADQADFVITDLIQDHAEWNAAARSWLGACAGGKTLAAYRYDLAQYFSWCVRHDVNVLEAEQEDIDEYRHILLRKFEPATTARKLAALSSFYRHSIRRKTVKVNPVTFVERPKGDDESNAAGLDLDEVRLLFDAADRAGVTAAALVRILLFLGVRVAELSGATVKDMRTERGHRVLRVTRKGGRRQTLVIPVQAAVALDRHLGGRTEGPLFEGARGGPMSRYEVDKILSGLVLKAGINKPITPHSMRHTYATLALDAGVHIRDLQKAMGHKNVETTMRYDRARDRVDRSPAHALAEVLG